MNYGNIAKASLFAACIVGFSNYLSQSSKPYLAGLLIAIPVALPSMWFIENKHPDDLKKYIKGFAISISIYFMLAILFYNMVVKFDHDKKTTIIYLMVLWFILVVVCYGLFK